MSGNSGFGTDKDAEGELADFDNSKNNNSKDGVVAKETL